MIAWARMAGAILIGQFGLAIVTFALRPAPLPAILGRDVSRTRQSLARRVHLLQTSR